MTMIVPSHLPATLVVDGLTYQYFAPFKTPNTLARAADPHNGPEMYVYQAYTEAEEIPTLLLTREEVEAAQQNPDYRSRVFTGKGGRTVSLNELRHPEPRGNARDPQRMEWFLLAMDILAENFPVYLPAGEDTLRRFPHHFDSYANLHPYKNLNTGWMKFYSEQELHEMLDTAIEQNGGYKKITSARKNGYECSSAGDKRFSAFHAWMTDGRTIEHWYQCGTLDGRGKGYEPGGRNWRLGKGKPPLVEKDKETQWLEYYGFWDEWAKAHPFWMKELRWHASCNNFTLTDQFATGPINQARALAEWLNNNTP